MDTPFTPVAMPSDEWQIRLSAENQGTAYRAGRPDLAVATAVKEARTMGLSPGDPEEYHPIACYLATRWSQIEGDSSRTLVEYHVEGSARKSGAIGIFYPMRAVFVCHPDDYVKSLYLHMDPFRLPRVMARVYGSGEDLSDVSDAPETAFLHHYY